jgi:hypothetical protein
MEVPHTNEVRLLARGALQYLEHSATGEVVLLPADRHHTLAFNAAGFSYLQFLEPADCAGGAPRERTVYTHGTYFKTSLHRAASGRLFVKPSGGGSLWLDTLSEQHSSLVLNLRGHTGDLNGFKVWMYKSSVEGGFLFWDLPFLVKAITGTYTYDLLKSKNTVCNQIVDDIGLPKAHIIRSGRSLLLAARKRKREGGDGVVQSSHLARATDDTKISTQVLLWLLMRCSARKPRSTETDLINAKDLFVALLKQFCTTGANQLFYYRRPAHGEPSRHELCIADGGSVAWADVRVMLGRGITKRFCSIFGGGAAVSLQIC